MANRVLIIGNDADMREGLCAILQSHGYQHDSALTAVEAIERLQQQSYDLIIIDWNFRRRPPARCYRDCVRLRRRRRS